MSQRRTLILVAAIVIGALASFMVWQYVNGVKDNAYDNAQQVPVYLIKAQVSKGSYGQEVADKAIERTEIPRKFLPPNAIHSLDDIRGKIAVNDLVTNQIVVSDMFVDPSNPAAQTSMSQRLKKINGEDQVAITVQVDLIHGVADMLQPGDYVNVLIAPQGTTQADASGSPATAGTGAKTVAPNVIQFPGLARFLYQKVQILAIDKTPVLLPGESAAAASTSSSSSSSSATPAKNSSGLITLIVPAKAAQYLASAPPGWIYMNLVARDYKPQAYPPLAQAEKDTLPGEAPDKITPYGPRS